MKRPEEQFWGFLQTLPDIFCELDARGRFVFISDSIRQLGYRPAELIGKHFKKLVCLDDYQEASRAHVLPRYKGKKTGAKGSPKLFDERRTRRRITRYLELRLRPKGARGRRCDCRYYELHSSGKWEVTGRSARFLGTVGSLRDVTERKKTEKALRKWIRLGLYLAHSAVDRDAPPAIDPLPGDRRFVAPAWRNWPYNLMCQSFLLSQQWWANATTGVPGLTKVS